MGNKESGQASKSPDGRAFHARTPFRILIKHVYQHNRHLWSFHRSQANSNHRKEQGRARFAVSPLSPYGRELALSKTSRVPM